MRKSIQKKNLKNLSGKNPENKKYLLYGAGKTSVNNVKREDLAKTSIARQNFIKKAKRTVVHEHF